eukprot:2714758-Rhodomonas_salina.2
MAVYVSVMARCGAPDPRDRARVTVSDLAPTPPPPWTMNVSIGVKPGTSSSGGAQRFPACYSPILTLIGLPQAIGGT